MSEGRHSYVPFYVSDWVAGTSRMAPMQELVYFRICCYIWDKAEPCPVTELPLMLGTIDGWEKIVEQLISAGKLLKSPVATPVATPEKQGNFITETLVNRRALAVAIKAREIWSAKSSGGKLGAAKTNTSADIPAATPVATPAATPDGIPGKSPVATPDGTPDGSRPGVATQNQNQIYKENYIKEFEEWYAAFPRHVGRGQADRAYKKARTKTSAEILLAAARRYAEQRNGEDPKFTKHPATWLNGECWLDDGTVTEDSTIEDLNPEQLERRRLQRLLDDDMWSVDFGRKPTVDEARARLKVLDGEVYDDPVQLAPPQKPPDTMPDIPPRFDKRPVKEAT